ncbi:hypothetical protein GOP47_0001690 [Adiantum capillus-veneris]|uniref:Uncharacterized protein n=1 Tax=Adiantum capillus-veneris TaxID=13818 RepID=A0A9D4V9B5_ADICA|nr:hypothetical protein GOP47_0001690 [Adiantum capillus-veneris]
MPLHQHKELGGVASIMSSKKTGEGLGEVTKSRPELLSPSSQGTPSLTQSILASLNGAMDCNWWHLERDMDQADEGVNGAPYMNYKPLVGLVGREGYVPHFFVT